MRVVVVIYPVPAQSVFCVVCFFLFFLLQFTQKFFGELVLFHLARTPTKPARKIFSRKKEERRLENFSLFLSFVTHKTRFAVRAHLFITRKNGDVQRIYRATELLDQEKRVYGTLFYSGSNKSQLFVSSTQSIFCLR
tara:strand:- start:61 stop:471 length:411 start_codon:yes stop_codon:yes gene_type:complete